MRIRQTIISFNRCERRFVATSPARLRAEKLPIGDTRVEPYALFSVIWIIAIRSAPFTSHSFRRKDRRRIETVCLFDGLLLFDKHVAQESDCVNLTELENTLGISFFSRPPGIYHRRRLAGEMARPAGAERIETSLTRSGSFEADAYGAAHAFAAGVIDHNVIEALIDQCTIGHASPQLNDA